MSLYSPFTEDNMSFWAAACLPLIESTKAMLF